MINKRMKRIRFNLKKRNNGKIRLSVFRSLNNISVQAIDDNKGETIASATSNCKSFSANGLTKIEQSTMVGEEMAKKLLSINPSLKVYFDRGKYAYHGRVAALADGARKGGLEF